MMNRRQVLKLLPLSLLLGDSFEKRSALESESPEDVVKRLFRAAQRGDWARLLDAMSPDDMHRMRASLEKAAAVAQADDIGNAVEQIRLEPEPFVELRGLIDQLAKVVEEEEEKQSTAEHDDQEAVAAVRRVLDVANPLPRSSNQSDRDFLMAYLGNFEPFLKELDDAKLTIVGSLAADRNRIHVAYRLDGVLSLRPSIMTLDYSEAGWCAVGGDQLPLVAQLAAAEQRAPSLRVVVIGQLREAGLAHFVCEADCRFGADQFRPTFCSTWLQDDRELERIRANGCQPLIDRLEREIRASLQQAIKMGRKQV